VIKANLDIFFIELLRHQPNRKSISNNVNTYTQERLEEFLELLETHIASHKLVSQYADMLSLSNYQLNAITKATLGKTSSEVIDEHIILESKRHLLATSNQVTQVAYNLGYEDVSYFIRFFKKHTGYSPEAFRNNFR
jgi:AraC-like DNA-binding protein